MAVLEEQAAEVVVLIDGQPAQEYDNDDDTELDTDSEVTKYVEVVSGKEFAFRILLKASFEWGQADVVTARYSIDGMKGSGGTALLKCKTCPISHDTEEQITGEWSGSGDNAEHHRFVFVNLETHDMDFTDDVGEMKDQYAKLGNLEVVLWREQVLYTTDPSFNFHVEETKAIPEKALKGKPLEVGTSFKTTYGKRPRAIGTKKVEKYPFAKFRFKHRTRRALKSLLIIQRTPSPVALEQRPLDELSREELEELIRIQRAIQEVKRENNPLKRERAQTDSTPKPPLKTSKGLNGQTVYHIDSDDDEDGGEAQNENGARRDRPEESEIEVIDL